MKIMLLVLSGLVLGCTAVPKTSTYVNSSSGVVGNAAPINIDGTVMQIAAQLERQYPASIYSVDSADGVEYVVMVTGMRQGEYHRSRKISDARFAKDNYYILWAEQLAIRPDIRLVE